MGRDMTKLEHYCYLRYKKSSHRKYQLFWMNMHLKIGNVLFAK